MKPLSDAMRTKTSAALDYVLAETKKETAPKAIIDGLVADHGARWGYGSGATYHLRCAGASATNTAGDERGALRAWRRNAVLRLGQML